MRALALACLVLTALAVPAQAHQSSIKYARITLDGARVHVTLTVTPSDVTEPLGLAADARPAVADVLGPAVAHHVAGWLAITQPTGARCAPSGPTAGPDPDGAFVVVAWHATCPESTGPSGQRVLDFTAFFAVDVRHEAIVSVHAPGAPVETIIVRATSPTLVIGAGTAASFLDWIGYGMDHIYGGLDHVCFVLALLLVVVVQPDPAGWRARRPRRALRTTAVVITAFTVAHSLSLIAASLGWIHLPSRLVESLIAASIVYTAIEDVVRPDARWRFGLTFGFGLIHGLGFASMLEALLPPTQVIVPLLGFNLGVELGQLTVVAVALPGLWILCRVLGADRYRRLLIPLAAAPLALIGIKWLVERMGGV